MYSPRRVARLAVLAAVVAGATSAPALAGDVFVICNLDVKLLTTEVKDVFLGEKVFAGTVKLAPADNGALQAAFLEKALKLDVAKYNSIWTKKSFRDGVNPPPVKSSDSEAIAYVKSTVGACSYVGSEPAGVAVVGKF